MTPHRVHRGASEANLLSGNIALVDVLVDGLAHGTDWAHPGFGCVGLAIAPMSWVPLPTVSPTIGAGIGFLESVC